jgi:hypothetical protein
METGTCSDTTTMVRPHRNALTHAPRAPTPRRLRKACAAVENFWIFYVSLVCQHRQFNRIDDEVRRCRAAGRSCAASVRACSKQRRVLLHGHGAACLGSRGDPALSLQLNGLTGCYGTTKYNMLSAIDQKVRTTLSWRGGARGGVFSRGTSWCPARPPDGARSHRALYRITRPLAPPYSLHTILLKVESYKGRIALYIASRDL